MMKKALFMLIGLGLLCLQALAEEPALKPDHPDTYTVVKGDTLWAIAGRFLEKPWLWPEIWHNNPEIANPHLIYPGDVISLVMVDGKLKLTVNDRGEGGGTVKLSPGVRATPLENPIPAIPLDVINAFLVENLIVEPGELDAAAYVLTGAQDHIVTGAGDRIMARGMFEKNVPMYGMYRPGKLYKDPKTEEVLGQQAIDLGSAKVVNIENDVADLEIVRSTQEVRIKDRLLPTRERSIESIFHPGSPENKIEECFIIDVATGVSQVGVNSVVVLNKGKQDGLKEGNVMAIWDAGETVRDPVTGELVKVLDQKAGLLMVFNVFDRTSMALVLDANRPLNVGDSVRNP